MKITSIEAQRKRKDRVSVFLDEEFWIGMSDNLFLELGLNRGDSIDEARKKDIEAQVVEDGALGYALGILTGRSLSEKQLRDKLNRREYGPEVIQTVMQRCREYLLLDDENLAYTVAEYRRDNHQGEGKIKQKLLSIGISKELAEAAVEAAFEEQDEDELARKALQNKYRDKKFDRKEQSRATSFLIRTGFSMQTSIAVVKERALSDEEEIEKNNSELALKQLKQRYGEDFDTGDRDDYNKAYSYLIRKGFLSPVVKEALDSFKN